MTAPTVTQPAPTAGELCYSCFRPVLFCICGTASWLHRAACRPGTGVDAELFFPVGTTGAIYDAQVAEAKAICAACPVRTECLSYAMGALVAGIAGGLTADERRALGPAQADLGLSPTSRSEITTAAAEMLAQGDSPRQVAAAVGVSVRTAERWAKRTPKIQPCGTLTAFWRHRRFREEPCQPCRDAHNAAQRERYARKVSVA